MHAENSPKNIKPHGLRSAGLQHTHVDNTRRGKTTESAGEGPEGVPQQHCCTVLLYCTTNQNAGGPATACSCYIMREAAGSCSAHTPARVGFISARPMRALHPHQHQPSTHTTHTPDCHQDSLAVNTRAINCKAAILPCSNSLKASTHRIRTIPTLSTPSLLSPETSLHLVLRDRCTALQGHHKGVAA